MTYFTETEIGARVKALRERAGATQVEIGDALGVDQTAISKIEAGTRSLTARELVLVSSYFGVPASSLVSAEEPVLALRAGDAAPARVTDAVRQFNRYIDGYFGTKALVK